MAVFEPSKVPFIYRFLFLYFEPVAALFGSALLLFSPQKFLTTMSEATTYTASHQVVYSNLAATYALFAFNEAVVLRLTNDLTVWKALLCGILLCDAIHLYASWGALGSDVFWNPALWRMEDAVNLGSLWVQGLIRVAFIYEIGFPRSLSKGKQT